VSDTYTPPAPSNWGLPDDGRIYSYASFPSLNKDLFGNTRPPRQLLKGPEQQRTVVSNSQDILMRSVGGGKDKDNNKKGDKRNDKSTANDSDRTDDLEWALFLLVFKQNTNATKNAKGEFPASTITESREAYV